MSSDRTEKQNRVRSGFFRDDKGHFSMMRGLSFLSFFAAVGTSYMVLSSGNPTTLADTAIPLYFITGAFTPKAIQKFAEAKMFKGES